MEEAYRLKPLLSAATSELHLGYLQLEAAPENDEKNVVTGSDSDVSNRLIKIQIATHPLYPDLLSAYIECQKVMQYHSLLLLLLLNCCAVLFSS